MSEQEQTSRRYTLHGRRKGRPLRTGKTALMENLLPRLHIAVEGGVQPHILFPHSKDVWLEVGFGGGEHLAWQAQQHPNIGMMGCEPYMNAIANMLGHIDAGKIENIRIFNDDARLLMDALPDACIGRCFVLYPDPWPKKRHAVRRFIGPDNLQKLARIMKHGAELRVASDDPTLQEWMLGHLRAHKDFTPAPDTDNGMRTTRPDDWPATRYEQKQLAKKRANWKGSEYYLFVRK